MANNTYSPEEVTRLGEKIYFEKLRDELQKTHMGEYVVIDVETEQYTINPDMLTAINEAREKFGSGKLFHIIQVGSLEGSAVNYKDVKYAWRF